MITNLSSVGLTSAHRAKRPEGRGVHGSFAWRAAQGSEGVSTVSGKVHLLCVDLQ